MLLLLLLLVVRDGCDRLNAGEVRLRADGKRRRRRRRQQRSAAADDAAARGRHRNGAAGARGGGRASEKRIHLESGGRAGCSGRRHAATAYAADDVDVVAAVGNADAAGTPVC